MIFSKKYSILFLLVACTAFKCVHKISSFVVVTQKITGVSIASGPQNFDTIDVGQWKQLNAKWVCLMPYAFVNTETGKLIYNNNQQWKGETYEGIKKAIILAKLHDLKVCIKPQLWFGHNKYTGDINFAENGAQWINFKTDYSRFIDKFHHLADSLNCDLFCIGTELNLLLKNHIPYWENLISDLRKNKMELTYAENWDAFEDCPLWRKLDFIGVNAYFPVSNEKNCSQEKLNASWESILMTLEKVSAEVQKPILFTEFGYRSIDYCGKEPWNYSSQNKVNELNQFNCLNSLFNHCWEKPWFAGGFLWKEYGHLHPQETDPEKDFTITNKKSYQLIQDYYAK